LNNWLNLKLFIFIFFDEKVTGVDKFIKKKKSLVTLIFADSAVFFRIRENMSARKKNLTV